VAADKEPLHLHALRNRFLRTPNVCVRKLDPENASSLEGDDSRFDTVLCVNVLEYQDPDAVLETARRALQPGGVLIVLVPQSAGLFGSLDRALGHARRFDATELENRLVNQGFEIRQTYELNKIGRPAWWLFSRVLGRKQISKPTLKVFDKTVWIWRRVDGILPWRGLSLIAIARKVDASA
jgi:SAM-dependent methyltransferase